MVSNLGFWLLCATLSLISATDLPASSCNPVMYMTGRDLDVGYMNTTVCDLFESLDKGICGCVTTCPGRSHYAISTTTVGLCYAGEVLSETPVVGFDDFAGVQPEPLVSDYVLPESACAVHEHNYNPPGNTILAYDGEGNVTHAICAALAQSYDYAWLTTTGNNHVIRVANVLGTPSYSATAYSLLPVTTPTPHTTTTEAPASCSFTSNASSSTLILSRRVYTANRSWYESDADVACRCQIACPSCTDFVVFQTNDFKTCVGGKASLVGVSYAGHTFLV